MCFKAIFSCSYHFLCHLFRVVFVDVVVELDRFVLFVLRLSFLRVNHSQSHLYDGALVVVKVVDVDYFDLHPGVLEEKVQLQ